MENLPTISQTEIEAVKGEVVLEIADVLKLQQIVEDYSSLRSSVLKNLEKLEDVSSNLKQELEIEGYDPKMVDSWNSLIKTSNESLKILTESYKNISSILLAIHKVNSLDKHKQTQTEEYKVENVADIIKRLKSKPKLKTKTERN